MALHQVMKFWTVIVTAFLALRSALGFARPTAGTAVARTEPVRNSDIATVSSSTSDTARVFIPAMSSPWTKVYARSLPPTMKQRIHAEAHGKSPSCRHRPTTDMETTADLAGGSLCDSLTQAEPALSRC